MATCSAQRNALNKDCSALIFPSGTNLGKGEKAKAKHVEPHDVLVQKAS